MTTLHRFKTVPYSAEQMYRLINDVNSYPEFLPWCSGARVIEDKHDEMVATIELSAAGVHKAFTTRNRLHPYHYIKMEHIEGPFKHLAGEWRLENLPEGGCKVELDLEFEVPGGMAGRLFGMLYTKVADKLVDCFCDRANDLYGASS